jgi:hypothetical protein
MSEEPEDGVSSSDNSLDSGSLQSIHRTNSQRSINSHCSVLSKLSASYYKIPPIDTVHQENSEEQLLTRRSSSLLISPSSSLQLTTRSKSINDYGVDDFLLVDSSKCSSCIRHSSSSDGQDFVISIPVPDTSASSTDSSSGGLNKFTKLKEKLFNVSRSTYQEVPIESIETGQNIDGESTPLVSKLSRPSHSTANKVFKTINPNIDNSLFLASTTTSSLKANELANLKRLDYYTVPLDSVLQESNSSSGSHSLSRQNAQDWENPETPV